MSKERVEEIKKSLTRAEQKRENLQMEDMFNILENLMIKNDLSYLIEQAETYQKCNVAYDELTHEFNLLKEQNKRYRELINNINEKASLFGVDVPVYEAIQDAIKALEGDPHD